MIIEMPKDVALPATGTINYKSILVKGTSPKTCGSLQLKCVPETRRRFITCERSSALQLDVDERRRSRRCI
jgi:hypothetical protein